MSAELHILSAGPGVSVQDAGRPGLLSEGVSMGGAADRLALAEGAALLGQAPTLACIEMAGMGGCFSVTHPVRIALTGAPMAADLDGRALRWNASHPMEPGQVLTVGGARTGVYGYLHIGGGIATQPLMGSRSAHLTAGLGRLLRAGDILPLGRDTGGAVEMGLDVADRSTGGTLDILPVAQTELFDAAALARLEATVFTRDARGNRQGVRLAHDGAGFLGAGQLSVLSEIIQPGDIQMTGEGTPYLLLADCQTTGGYPRIGTVAPHDLPRVAQSAPGTALRLRFVAPAQARARWEPLEAATHRLRRAVTPLLRDPARMTDLLSYGLVDGAVNARAPHVPGALEEGTEP